MWGGDLGYLAFSKQFGFPAWKRRGARAITAEYPHRAVRVSELGRPSLQPPPDYTGPGVHLTGKAFNGEPDRHVSADRPFTRRGGPDPFSLALEESGAFCYSPPRLPHVGWGM